jgi:hypothetical protein
LCDICSMNSIVVWIGTMITIFYQCYNNKKHVNSFLKILFFC